LSSPSRRHSTDSGGSYRGGHLRLRVAIAMLLTSAVLLATVVAALLNRWYVTQNVARLLEDIGWQGVGHGMGQARMITELLANTGFAGRLTDSVILSGLIGAVIAGLIGFFAASQIARPLTALADRVRRLAAGDYRPLDSATTQPLPGMQGITEVADIDSAVGSLGVQLAAAEDLRRRLVEDLAHELRSPLTAVRGYAEGLLDGVFPDPRSVASGMQRELARIERLIADLRNSALPSEPGPMAQLDLSELAATVVSGFAVAARERRVDLAAVAHAGRPGDVSVLGDRDRLGQVIANLVENAIKFTPAGGRVRVAVEPLPGHTEVQLTVSDSGPGIPPTDLPHIFDRLYRAESSRARSTGGTGIGLAVVKQIILTHKGTVTAGNAPGGGAVLTVRLPRA